VIKFNPSTGVHLGDFVSAGSGGLATPTGLVFGPDGDLYVSGTTAIYKYDGSTGAFISKFVDNNPAGFQPFQGIEFGPDGHLYSVDNNGGYIRKYNGATGA
jgi:streptogramin lyase